MRSSRLSKATHLLADLIVAVDSVGIKKTADHLHKLTLEKIEEKIEFHNADTECVVMKVSDVSKVAAKEIMNGSGRANNRRIAIGLCAYYLHYSFGHQMRDVQKFIKTDRFNCYRYSKEIIDLDQRHAAHREYIAWKSELDKHFPKAKLP